jgi:hypothetical protein
MAGPGDQVWGHSGNDTINAFQGGTMLLSLKRRQRLDARASSKGSLRVPAAATMRAQAARCQPRCTQVSAASSASRRPACDAS